MFSINAHNTYTQKEWLKNLFVLQLWPTASELVFFSMQKLYHWYFYIYGKNEDALFFQVSNQV